MSVQARPQHIPFNDLKAQYTAHEREIDAALRRVLERGFFVLGEEGEAFEREFAAYCGAAHGVAVASGTDALRLALAAFGVGRGHEVITVANAGVPPVAAIVAVGARPVFVDVDAETQTLDPKRLEVALTSRTRALMPVHLYGQPVEVSPILTFAREHGLRVVEDCAQAHGAAYAGRRVGSLADSAAFSFYPTKNLGALGDAGMVVTNDSAIADRVRLLRNYGWRTQYYSELHSTHSRLDELQAAVLRAKLVHLDEWNAARRTRAERYAKRLPPAVQLRVAPWAQHSFHLYVIRTRRRDQLRKFLGERGIGTGVHYPLPAHLQPPYRHFGRGPGSLPETERAAQEVLSLPMFPELPLEWVDCVAACINDFFNKDAE